MNHPYTKAIEQNGLALRFVKNQTEEIRLKAVEEDGETLRYVQNQTEEICLKAVEQNRLDIVQALLKTFLLSDFLQIGIEIC